MRRLWQKSLSALALAFALSVSVVGCYARPAPRPELKDPATPAVHSAVAYTAAQIGGAGHTAAVVMGDVALVAIQLDAAVPGGTAGGRLGETNVLDGRGTGGGNTAIPAMPGGGYSPNPGRPGGVPNSTQAVPNAHGGPGLLTGGTVAPAPATSSAGTTPMDVMNRIADQIRAEHRFIREVRVLNVPEDAVRLARVSRELTNGASIATHRQELLDLYHRGINLGTTQTGPMHPTEGSDFGINTDR